MQEQSDQLEELKRILFEHTREAFDRYFEALEDEESTPATVRVYWSGRSAGLQDFLYHIGLFDEYEQWRQEAEAE